ncbi:adenylate/guanylate cyclase domain-containing protein [uncultured Tateyamaria sp.]|uniref:adenylate/guanylate cyclase domain-containing protein n=1 Tax=Tateyamaria sp. 1078 TaxID=3417464 RepID=UPI002624A6AA|nr:adenylate/guanylate cyclase domain-containing protein [uncultured Tateyamaria sp.]
MTHVLWRGTWATRIRIVSGLVLMLYVTLHLLNIASVLISPDFAEIFQDVRLYVTRSIAGGVVVGSALLAHLILSLAKLVRQRSLRMPLVDYLQIAFGLAIPLLLSSHFIYTSVAFQQFGVETQIGYVTTLIWGRADGWMQAALVLVVWVHGSIGMHMWLKGTEWWRRNVGWMVALAVLIPTLALLGYVTAARAISGLLYDSRAELLAKRVWNWPGPAEFTQLGRIDAQTDQIIWAVLAAFFLLVVGRQAVAALRKPIRVTYVDGPTVRAPRGQTVLETSRGAGVPHTSLCGGRGRCTTCRVVLEEGHDNVPPPSAAETRSLTAVGASGNARLACQMRPTGPVTVYRVFAPDGSRKRAHASHGHEARLAILFLDMRGFTARTDGQLPYDVVFLLNRFFDQIVPPLNKAGGTVDKYMGDGLMALFEDDSPARSARAALQAVEGIGRALRDFNETLEREGSPPVAIGVGVHLGNVVLGEIGAAGQAPRTLIGDAVNTASRLEAETKVHGVEALISEDVLAAAGLPVSHPEMLSLHLRGREEPLDALAVPQAADLQAVLGRLGHVVPAQ